MPRTLVKSVAALFAIVAIFLTTAAICSCVSTIRFIEISNQADYSREVIRCLTDLQALVKDAETGQRGFLLTGGKDEYLQPYNHATTKIDSTLAKLASFADGGSALQRRMAEDLKPLIKEKLSELAETIRLHRSVNAESAIALVKTDQGKRCMDRIRDLIDEGFSYERRRLDESAVAARYASIIMLFFNIFCSIVTLSILATVFLHVQGEMRKRTRIEVELAQARDAAVSATRTKSEFLANMSHEIRTPMNGVLGMTELALETELTPRQREYLDTVKSSAESLLTVIGDILDFSKIEAGKLRLDSVPFSPRECVEETIRSLALRAHFKGLELACRIAPEVPEALVGDPGRLRQIVMNLVGNAIKFTAHGEIVVTVAQVADEEVICLKFIVSDTGIGIPAGKLAAIFNPFEQADGSTTREFGGSGLGLSISSRLIDLMGGEIMAESEPGQGSTFCFTAKFERADVGAFGLESPGRLKNLSVLIVDDYATNRTILEEILAAWGARPTSAESGAVALEALRQAAGLGEPFAVALIDGLMPGMNGLELASAIRADPTIANTVLVLLSSADRSDDLPLYRSLGIACVLTKPVRRSELFDALVREHVHAKTAVDRSERIGEVEVRPTINPDRALHVLLAEDNQINQKVAANWLEKLGHSVLVVSDGSEALKALEVGAFDLVLMDLQMPIMDGFEAVRVIRELEEQGAPKVQAIALTAHAMAGDHERCLAAGFDGYLTKPIREADLRQALSCIERPHATSGGLSLPPLTTTTIA